MNGTDYHNFSFPLQTTPVNKKIVELFFKVLLNYSVLRLNNANILCLNAKHNS